MIFHVADQSQNNLPPRKTACARPGVAGHFRISIETRIFAIVVLSNATD
jgi:hypothetical protein